MKEVSINSNNTRNSILFFMKEKGKLVAHTSDRFGNITIVKLDTVPEYTHKQFDHKYSHVAIGVNIYVVNEVEKMAEILLDHIMGKLRKNYSYPLNAKGQIILVPMTKYEKRDRYEFSVAYSEDANPDFMEVLIAMKKSKKYDKVKYRILERYSYLAAREMNDEPEGHQEYLIYEGYLKKALDTGIDLSKDIINRAFNAFAKWNIRKPNENENHRLSKKFLEIHMGKVAADDEDEEYFY